jgi:hypothetical protein
MLALLLALSLLDTPETPLPDAGQIRTRAIETMRKSAQALERYSCKVQTRTDELDGRGGTKKSDTETVERFFVNGARVNHVLARNGKTLSGKDAEKAQKKADKNVTKYSKEEEAQKLQDKREQQIAMFLRAHRLVNGKRELRGGHNTVQYDLQSDPQFRPRTVEERFAQATSGRVVFEEKSGALVEIEIRTDRDVKLAGGLLANLHKGFLLHAICERQPDGLWIAKLVDGNADLTAGLFFHPRIHFQERTEECHLFSVDSKDVLHSTSQ